MLGVRAHVTKIITAVPDLLKVQTRNTFILRRKYPPPLHPKNGKTPKMRGRHFVYDLVKDSNLDRQPNLKIILKQFVEGVGNVGDILSLRPTMAYNDYLLPGLAVYANPENMRKFKVDESKPSEDVPKMSPYVQRTINCLSKLQLQITMNKIQPWTLEPWHIKASFRKVGFVVPEHAIQLPPKQIKGPDLSIQGKEFYITVIINQAEKVNVRCRIHHWATGLDRLPWEEFHWKKPAEPLFPEQAEVLEKMQ